MSDDPTGSGNPPEGTPPPAPVAEGAERFRDFSVDKQGVVRVGEEVVTREFARPEKVEASPDEPPAKIRIDDTELTIDEIRALRQEAEQVRKLKEELEPYDTIVKDSRFRDLLEQGVAEGYWEAPPIPVAQPSDMGKYHALQTSDPLFDDVREAMISYSANLSFEQQQALNNNPTYFLKIYNEIRSTAGDKPLPRRNTSVSDIIKRIQSKESAKDRAVIQRPGGGDSESSDKAAAKRSHKADMQLLRSGSTEDIANVLMKRVFRQGNE